MYQTAHRRGLRWQNIPLTRLGVLQLVTSCGRSRVERKTESGWDAVQYSQADSLPRTNRHIGSGYQNYHCRQPQTLLQSQLNSGSHAHTHTSRLQGAGLVLEYRRRRPYKALQEVPLPPMPAIAASLHCGPIDSALPHDQQLAIGFERKRCRAILFITCFSPLQAAQARHTSCTGNEEIVLYNFVRQTVDGAGPGVEQY